MVETLNLFGEEKAAEQQQTASSKSRRTVGEQKSEGAYRTISEVAKELGVATHVLRFWETKFNQIKPLKRAGGRRYYRPEDVELIMRIRSLLYDEGYTIRGVQAYLKKSGVRSARAAETMPMPQASGTEEPVSAETAAAGPLIQPVVKAKILEELKELKAALA